jgi:hypothetical protein
VSKTSQPGLAPGRDVVDRYDISGYFTKAEATEDKLYSLVKSGVRQYETTRNLAGTLAMLEGVIASSQVKQAMKDTFMAMLSGLIPTDRTGNG